MWVNTGEEHTYVRDSSSSVQDIVTDNLRLHRWSYRCKPGTQNAYQRVLRKKKSCLQLLLTAQHDTHAHCYLKHNWSCNMSKPTQRTSATLQLLLTQQALQIGPTCTYTVYFWLRMSSGITVPKYWPQFWESGEHYTQKECIRTTFSTLTLWTCAAGWNCAVGLILTPIWFLTFCSRRGPVYPRLSQKIQVTPIYQIMIMP
jgi:hypothetical protein